jgi:aerobic carbon-monoxide dehydrogenase medium subunit
MSTTFASPTTLTEACRLLAADGAQPLAGGVAFTMALTKGQVEPTAIIFLRHLEADLRGISCREDEDPTAGLRIGPLTTHGELLRHPAVAAYEPRLVRMFADVGNVRVRAVGTIGGNLAYADPRHDPAPLLCALGATVTVQSSGGERELPLERLATGSFQTVLAMGELLTAVHLPERAAGLRCGWSKLQSSSLDDYATVSVAVTYRVEDGVMAGVRVFLGAADSHVRPLSASARLNGAAVDAEGAVDATALDEAADQLAAEITPGGNHRGSPGYKRELARVALHRAIDDSRDRGVGA